MNLKTLKLANDLQQKVSNRTRDLENVAIIRKQTGTAELRSSSARLRLDYLPNLRNRILDIVEEELTRLKESAEQQLKGL